MYGHKSVLPLLALKSGRPNVGPLFTSDPSVPRQKKGDATRGPR